MSEKRRIRKRDIAVLVVTIAILVGLIIFCSLNGQLIVKLFDAIVKGKNIVQEYILGWGWLGVAAIVVVLLICFFFPFLSSLPIQIVCVMTYGLGWATLIVSISIAFASQLLFLIERNLKTFCYTKKQRKKQEDIENRIKNSSRNINLVMVLLYIVPLIPFLIIASIACRSNMKWWKYTLYTTLGVVPEVFVTLLIGNQVTSNSSPILNTVILVAMIILIVLMLVFKDKMIYWIFKPKKETLQTEATDGENPEQQELAEQQVLPQETSEETPAEENSDGTEHDID